MFTTNEEAYEIANLCQSLPPNGELDQSISKLLNNSEFKLMVGINNQIIENTEYINAPLHKLTYISDQGLSIDAAKKCNWFEEQVRYNYGKWLKQFKLTNIGIEKPTLDHLQTCIANKLEEPQLPINMLERTGKNTPIFMNDNHNRIIKVKKTCFTNPPSIPPSIQTLSSIKEIFTQFESRDALIFEFLENNTVQRKLFNSIKSGEKIKQIIRNIGKRILEEAKTFIHERNTQSSIIHTGTHKGGPNHLINVEWNSSIITLQGIPKRYSNENTFTIIKEIILELKLTTNDAAIQKGIDDMKLLSMDILDPHTLLVQVEIENVTVSWENDATLEDETHHTRNAYSEQAHNIFTILPPSCQSLINNDGESTNSRRNILHTITTTLHTHNESLVIKTAEHSLFISGITREEGAISMAQRTITYLILNALDISLYDIITNDMYLGIPNIAFLFVDILKIIPQTNQKKTNMQ